MKSLWTNGVRGLVLSALMALSVPVLAQTDEASNANLRFNFALPGARSLAMGGAFLGLADDASAAFVNPAGLARVAQSLKKAELSFSATSWGITNRFPFTGRVPGDEQGPATMDGLDQTDYVLFSSRTEAMTGLDFASVVLPISAGGVRKGGLAFYRHELARIDYSFAGQGGFAWAVPDPDYFDDDGLGARNIRLDPYLVQGQFRIFNYGVSFGYRVSSKLSLGVGGSAYQLRLESLESRYEIGPSREVFSTGMSAFTDIKERANQCAGSVYLIGAGADVFEICREEPRQASEKQWAAGVNLGLLWEPSERLSVGLVYRSGPSFTYETRYALAQAPPPGTEAGLSGFEAGILPDPSPIDCRGNNNPLQGCSEDVATATFRVPHTAGVGFAYRTQNEKWRFLVDANWVNYERLVNGFTSQLITRNPEGISNFKADDAVQAHIGIEYAVGPRSRTPMFFRAGFWNDPDGKIRYERTDGDVTYAGAAKEFLWQRGLDLYHVTAGFGMATGTFQLDFAVDYAARGSGGDRDGRVKALTSRLSTVFRF